MVRLVAACATLLHAGQGCTGNISPARRADAGADSPMLADGGGLVFTDGGGFASDDGGTSDGTQPTTPAGILARKLGKSHFLIGLGNDLKDDHDQDGAYTLGTTLDIHYAYLVGLKGRGGWPDWNANGQFVNVLTDAAKKHGCIPMFTLYSMAAQGENNLAALTDDDYMRAYWDGARLLYERLGVFGDHAMVQFEPDFWAYAQHASPGGDPTLLPVHVSSLAPDCEELPDNLVGMAECLMQLGRKYAPRAALGFHASEWADPDPNKVASFLVKIGAQKADFVTTDTLDRDAGCFEAKVDPNCQRSGNFYWDATNRTSPNFREHLRWVETITAGIGKPMLWWQTPLGVPSDTPGGSAGRYRDNRVKYIFEHIDEFVAAGGVGAVFGTGATNQTDISSDGGQFKNAVKTYMAAPMPLR